MLRKALRSLPNTLDETYDRILLKVSEENHSLAIRLLRWLAFSARLLTLEEMAEILSIDDGDEIPRFDSDQRLRDPRDILDICSTLVTVFSDDKSDSWLRLAHLSVKEYLISERTQVGAASRYYLSNELANAAISRACLAYLLHFDEEDSLILCTPESLSLGQYAAEFWILHAQAHGQLIAQESFQKLIISLFRPGSVQHRHWILLHDIDNLHLKQRRYPPYIENTSDKEAARLHLRVLIRYIGTQARRSEISPSPLYYAILMGLESVTHHLIASTYGKLINTFGGRFGTPLVAASAAGHAGIVQLLLDNGAGGGRQQGNALIVAAAYGHKHVVQLLLDQEVDVNLVGGHDYCALIVVSSEGHLNLVHFLLEKGADVRSCTPRGKDAMIGAAISGHEDIVRLLLERGADINQRWGNVTALLGAANSGHENIVRLLLERGADINQRRGNFNALGVACHRGYENIARLVLEHGTLRKDIVTNALVGASYLGHEKIVRLLIDKGADVNADIVGGTTAIVAAAENGHESTVRLLLDIGADVSLCRDDGTTALTAASKNNHTVIAQALAESGAHAVD